MRCAVCGARLGRDDEQPPARAAGLPACEGCGDDESGPELRDELAGEVTPWWALEAPTGDPGPCEAHGVGGSCGRCLLEGAIRQLRGDLALGSKDLTPGD